MRPIRMRRGILHVGPMNFNSGSGGGGSGPPKPHDKPAPVPPNPTWWQKFLASLKKHLP